MNSLDIDISGEKYKYINNIVVNNNNYILMEKNNNIFIKKLSIIDDQNILEDIDDETYKLVMEESGICYMN